MSETVTHAKLEWDKTGERLYETGVTKCALYPLNASTGKYDKGVAWNGITSITESPEGAEATDLYADDIKYASFRSLETFGGSIEAYTYPAEFAVCDGTASPANGVYFGQQPRSKFGLCYRTAQGSDAQSDTSKDYKLHLVYGATASPSQKQYSSINDSPEAITFSWDFTTDPVNATGAKALSTIVIDSIKVSAAGLAALENALYGSTTKDAYLPLPDEVLSLLATTGSSGT